MVCALLLRACSTQFGHSLKGPRCGPEHGRAQVLLLCPLCACTRCSPLACAPKEHIVDLMSTTMLIHSCLSPLCVHALLTTCMRSKGARCRPDEHYHAHALLSFPPLRAHIARSLDAL
eukprot:1155308-Pelagomonas_calceolata.AAC.6